MKTKDFLKQHKAIRQFRKWIKALRSDNYKQTRLTLQDKKGFCCLGVACDILIPDEDKMFCSGDGNLFGGYPSQQSNSPEWLKLINEDFKKRYKNSDREDLYPLKPYALSDLNDTLGLTFNEIADILEAVYLYGVWDEVSDAT